MTLGRPVVEPYPWGELSWFAGSAVGLSESVTLGRCVIRAGQQNQRHSHPNCEEVLALVSGTILHSLGDDRYEMHPGDTIAIPAGVPHHAVNVGVGDAVMTIAYPTAHREFVAE